MSFERVFDLTTPYAERNQPDFESAVGSAIPSARALGIAIVNDLDEETHGIGWWRGLDTRSRILASDQLVICAGSIETNFTEAVLSAEMLKQAYGEESDFHHRERFEQYQALQFGVPERKRPRDDLAIKLAGLHLAGVFRALGSALDCLAGTTYAVLGVPSDVRTASGQQLKREVSHAAGYPTPLQPIQQSFLDVWTAARADSAPEGWLEWVLEYRNMLVHRGRRMDTKMVTPTASAVLNSTGRPWIVGEVISHLAANPADNEIEALVRSRANQSWPSLAETATVSVDHAIAALRNLLNVCLANLASAWSLRRDDFSLQHQPAEIWTSKGMSRHSFQGFTTAERNTATEIRMGPLAALRLRAGAALDHHAHLWDDTEPDEPTPGTPSDPRPC